MIALAESMLLPPAEIKVPTDYFGFVIFWVILGLSSFLFFHFSRNTALKRKLFPVFTILMGVIFGVFIYCTTARVEPRILYFMVPAIVLLSVVNIRKTRFCDSCGKTLYQQPIFGPTQLCRHCGGKIQ